MTMYRVLISAVAVMIALAGNTVFAQEIPLPNKPHLVIEGVGEVEQLPDIVTLHLAVSATADNFSVAKDQVDGIIAKAIKAAKKHGVKADDINASQIHAAPQYEWQNQQRLYKGEQVNRQLTVVLKQPENYNDLVESLLDAGVSRLQNVELGFSNKDELEAKALKLAIDNAQQQAKTIAGYLDTQVHDIYQIAPLSSGGPILYRADMAMKAESSERAPLSLARQTVQQRVRIVYLLPAR